MLVYDVWKIETGGILGEFWLEKAFMRNFHIIFMCFSYSENIYTECTYSTNFISHKHSYKIKIVANLLYNARKLLLTER